MICFGAVNSECTTPSECSLKKDNVFKVKSSVIQHRMQDISMSIVGFVSHTGINWIGFCCCVLCISHVVADFACGSFWKVNLCEEGDCSVRDVIYIQEICILYSQQLCYKSRLRY